jgi:hypothetical protein
LAGCAAAALSDGAHVEAECSELRMSSRTVDGKRYEYHTLCAPGGGAATSMWGDEVRLAETSTPTLGGRRTYAPTCAPTVPPRQLFDESQAKVLPAGSQLPPPLDATVSLRVACGAPTGQERLVRAAAQVVAAALDDKWERAVVVRVDRAGTDHVFTVRFTDEFEQDVSVLADWLPCSLASPSRLSMIISTPLALVDWPNRPPRSTRSSSTMKPWPLPSSSQSA